MLDLLIKGGCLIGGTGAPEASGDAAIKDGRIVEVGRITEPARHDIDADGLLVTPGWVSVHDH
jgi:N-acyl-D-amino-acid deacylase